LKFEWDEEKNRINKLKHDISFETAAHVFDDPYYIEMFDFEHSADEERSIAIGMVGKVLFVVFTERKDKIRLISARIATDEERSLYYDENIHY
jgi:hypothetical protein